MLLHLLGQNISVSSYGEVLHGLIMIMNEDNSGDTPSAPSTLEMAPIYPEIEKYGTETEL